MTTHTVYVTKSVSQGFAVWKQCFRHIVSLNLWLLLMLVILGLLLLMAMGISYSDFSALADPKTWMALEESAGALWSVIPLGLAMSFLFVIQSVGMIRLSFYTYKKKELPQVGQFVWDTVRQAVYILPVAIVVGIPGAIGEVLSYLPYNEVSGILWTIVIIVLGILWVGAIPMAVVENLGVVDALRRSMELVRGHVWKTIGALLAGMLIMIFFLTAWLLLVWALMMIVSAFMALGGMAVVATAVVLLLVVSGMLFLLTYQDVLITSFLLQVREVKSKTQEEVATVE